MGTPDLRFNLSHTTGLIACALTVGREVGVDVERIDRKLTHEVPERFFSGGVGSPAGVFGSKKPSGFGMLATRTMFLAASPASRSPAFKPTRGSAFAAGDGCGCCSVRAVPAAASRSAAIHRVLSAADVIS